MNQVNKRTLNKRVRKSIILTVFITLFLFTSMILFWGAEAFKSLAASVSDQISFTTARDMNSAYFLKQMNINGLEEFTPNSPQVLEWLRAFENTNPMNNNPTGSETNESILNEKNIADSPIKQHMNAKKPGIFFNPNSLMLIEITLNDNLLYSNASQKNNGFILDMDAIRDAGKNNAVIKSLLSYYNVKSSKDLYDSAGNVIGNVSVKINDTFLIVTFLVIASSLIFVATISLFIAAFISKLMSLPVSAPISSLDKQFKAVASGDYDTTMNAKIVLKKPLKEIESLANSTNMIIEKMKEYNILLSSQNDELEAQNEELETQKEQLKDAQTQLIQNEKMASIGQLTAAITHEINTPLGAVNSNVQLSNMLICSMLEMEEIKRNEALTDVTDKLLEVTKTSLMACTRISEIIRSLKNFSKLDQAEYQEANLKDNIKSVLILTSNLWKNNISIHEDYAELQTLKCFPGMLNQVFMNLIVNAVQAIPGKGDIFIKTYTDNKYAYVSIRDTGTGIKEEDLTRIFDSGFSTKKTGMGLGLSICLNIMKKHNGDLKVTSDTINGTEFIVCIPITP